MTDRTSRAQMRLNIAHSHSHNMTIFDEDLLDLLDQLDARDARIAENAKLISLLDDTLGVDAKRISELEARIASLHLVNKEILKQAESQLANARDRADKGYSIIRECAEALGNGAALSPECTDDFHALLPREIAAFVSSLRNQLANARESALEEAAKECDRLQRETSMRSFAAAYSIAALNIRAIAKPKRGE